MTIPPARDTSAPYAVLFVCLGNICRSPLAEGLFLHHARERGLLDRLTIDSCGTGAWHVGNRPDPRSIAVARAHGVDLPGHARQWDASRDPRAFDLIVPMDRCNRRNLLGDGAAESRVRLMRSFDPGLAGLHHDDEAIDVPDPYYGGDDGFEDVYRMLDTACRAMLDAISERL